MNFENHSPFFSRLSPESQRKLAAAGKVKTFRPAQLIHQAGDDTHALSIVRSGQIRFYSADVDGGESTVSVLGPGEAFGELTALAGLPRGLSAEAIGETEIVELKPAELHRLLDEDGALRRQILENMALTVAFLIEAVHDERMLSLEQRLSKALHVLSGASRSEVALSQFALAAYLGVTRVSIGKALAKLTRRGLVKTRYGGVDILDGAGLARLAGLPTSRS